MNDKLHSPAAKHCSGQSRLPLLPHLAHKWRLRHRLPARHPRWRTKPTPRHHPSGGTNWLSFHFPRGIRPRTPRSACGTNCSSSGPCRCGRAPFLKFTTRSAIVAHAKVLSLQTPPKILSRQPSAQAPCRLED